MSRHTSYYSSYDMRVPDIEQHIVHPRSGAPSIPARNANRPRLSRHMDYDDSQSVTSRGRQYDSSMSSSRLLQLAGYDKQVPNRPANALQQESRPIQSSSRQGALTTSNPSYLDESSWLGSNPERLLAPCRDRVQSIPQELSVRRSIRSESTPVVDYGRTALAGQADQLAHADVEYEYGNADIRNLAGSMPAPISRLSSNTRPRSVQPQPEQPRSRPAATPRSSLAPVPCQADLGRPGLVLDAGLSARQQAAVPAARQLDNVSIHSLDIRSEALPRATLEEGRGQTKPQSVRRRPIPSRRTLVPAQTVGLSRADNLEVVYDYGHVEQPIVDPAHSSDRVTSLVVPPARRQIQSVCVPNLADQYSMEDRTPMPCAGVEGRPYESTQVYRQPVQHPQAVPNTVYYSQANPDLLGPALGRAIEPIKLTKFNGKSDVEEFIADYLDIVHHNGWSDSQSLLQLRLTLTGEELILKDFDPEEACCSTTRSTDSETAC